MMYIQNREKGGCVSSNGPISRTVGGCGHGHGHGALYSDGVMGMEKKKTGSGWEVCRF